MRVLLIPVRLKKKKSGVIDIGKKHSVIDMGKKHLNILGVCFIIYLKVKDSQNQILDEGVNAFGQDE